MSLSRPTRLRVNDKIARKKFAWLRKKFRAKLCTGPENGNKFEQSRGFSVFLAPKDGVKPRQTAEQVRFRFLHLHGPLASRFDTTRPRLIQL